MEKMLEDEEEFSAHIISWDETLTCWCK